MTAELLAATHPTPAGPVTLVVDGDEVAAAGFTDDVDRVVALLGPSRRGRAVARGTSAGVASEAVLAWADGEVEAPLAVPVAWDGSTFQLEVWAALRRIPAGRPLGYAGLAAEAGRPTAVRAAGRGCATNRASLFVPCHRVVPAGGGVGGFLWGADPKRLALAHEAAHAG